MAHFHELQDSVGYVAAALVVSAFYMKKTSHLRVIAIGSNLAFLTYGSLAHLLPVIALHLTLLPINVWRLFELSSSQPPEASSKASADPSSPRSPDALDV
jgi:hypothetical protein